MAVLLTGASGLLGANLAHALAAQGVRPRLLLREGADRRGLRGVPHDSVAGDLADPASLRAAMVGIDRVFHVAGLVRFDPFSEEPLRRTNVEGTRNVLAAARASGVRRLVHVSSIAAVGHGPLSEPATEDTAFNFDGENPYHASKRAAEALALQASSAELEVVVANPTFVVGPFDARPTSGELLLTVARGLVAVFPAGGTNFVDARDVADGLIRLMNRGIPGERYILGGENLTFRQFLTLCAQEAGVRPPWVPVPDALLRTVGKVGDRVGRRAPDLFQHVNSAFLRTLGLTAYANSAKATRALGYQPRPVRGAIREAYRWFQEEGMLPRDRPLTPRA